jgi:hypothetical protein
MRRSNAKQQAFDYREDHVFVEAQSTFESEISSYGKELRALGQALEGHRFICLDLEIEGDAYVVRGRASIPKGAQASFSRFVRDLVTYAIEGGSGRRKPAGEVERRYTPSEVHNLDVKGRDKRKHPDKMPDPHSLSQILRSAGSYLDNRRNTSLVGISIKDRWVTVRYKTAEGRVEQARQDLEYFYNYWVKAYLRRSNRSKLPPPSAPTFVVTWDESQTCQA